jgi:DNA-directed RNA polymerase specialized sigma24 family protein
MDQISAAVDALPMIPGKPLRSLVLHRYKSGWTYERIAGHLLMSPQTARDAMHEAHSLIASKLQSQKARE